MRILLRESTDRFQPGFLPEQQTSGLTSSVRASVASRDKADAAVHSSPSNRKNRIASLVRTYVYLKFLPAEDKHLGHQRHSIDFAVLVERSENFFAASDPHPVTGAKLVTLRSQEQLPPVGH